MRSSAPTTSPSKAAPPAPARTRAAREAGFTLAEMLVVLAIIGICMAVAAPSLRNLSSTGSVASSAREVAALLRAARAEAIFSGRDARVSVDLERKVAAASWNGDLVAIPVTARISVRTARQEVGASSASFRFFADGSSTGGSIRLQTERASQRIAVDWLTGRVDRVVER